MWLTTFYGKSIFANFGSILAQYEIFSIFSITRVHNIVCNMFQVSIPLVGWFGPLEGHCLSSGVIDMIEKKIDGTQEGKNILYQHAEDDYLGKSPI